MKHRLLAWTISVFCLFAAGTSGVGTAGAQQIPSDPDLEPPTSHGETFTFAVPDFDSRISLGVFDPQGTLVRTLCSDKPESEFAIGLNGLIFSWDGKNDVAQSVEPGSYMIRGFAVGNFTLQATRELPISWGDAFGSGVEFREITQLGIGKDGVIYLLGTDPAGATVLVAYNTALSARLWSRVLDSATGHRWILGQPCEPAVAVMGAGQVELLDPATGRALLRGKVADAETVVHSLYLAPKELQWVTERGVNRVSMEDLSPLPPISGLPSGIVKYFADESGALALDSEGRLWTTSPTWTIFLHREGAWFADFAPGRDGRFWALVRARPQGQQRLGQFDREGEFLRQINPETFHGSPFAFAVARDETTLFVLAKNAATLEQQLVGIRRNLYVAPSAWEIFFERNLSPADWLHSEGFRVLPLRMQLGVASALGRGRESGIFRLRVTPKGISLSTSDGLPLGLLLRQEGIIAASAATSPENPRVLRLRLVLEGRYLECEVAGLDRIAQIDAGKFVWPPEE